MGLLAKTAYAAVEDSVTVEQVMAKIAENILNPIILFMFSVALVVFLWGTFKFLRGAADPKAREEGAKHILFGVVGMAVMIGAYGLIRIALGTFGLPIPTILG
jgi:hypothetical protein